MRRIAGFLATLLFLASIPFAYAQELEIGRMRVAVWPEYDSAGVLFVYDGRFKNNEDFPNETSFFIPKGAVISDVCSLSPKGQHFCQLFKQTRAGDVDEIRMRLPYPNFYLSFHTEPFDLNDTKRALRHIVKANHAIDLLEVDIQRPLRAEGFKIIRPAGLVQTERKGFSHFGARIEDVARGQVVAVELEYTKPDRTPSVNIKYTPKAHEGMQMGTAYSGRARFSRFMYMAAALGLVTVLTMGWLILRGRRSG